MIYHPEIFSQIESAKLKVDSSKIYLTKQQQELAYKVADAYVSILKYQNGVDVAESYVKTNLVMIGVGNADLFRITNDDVTGIRIEVLQCINIGADLVVIMLHHRLHDHRVGGNLTRLH